MVLEELTFPIFRDSDSLT